MAIVEMAVMVVGGGGGGSSGSRRLISAMVATKTWPPNQPRAARDSNDVGFHLRHCSRSSLPKLCTPRDELPGFTPEVPSTTPATGPQRFLQVPSLYPETLNPKA